MLNLPIKILDKVLALGGEAEITLTLGNLVTQWDAQEGLTSRHLVVIVNTRSSAASPDPDVFLQLNGDGGDNYNVQRIMGSGGSALANNYTGVASMRIIRNAGALAPANKWGSGVILLPHAFNTVDHKTVMGFGGTHSQMVLATVGRWANVAAVTSITLIAGGGTYYAGCEFLLGVIDERYLVGEVEDAAADFTPTWDNIPQGQGDLVVIGYPRSDRPAVEDEVNHIINDDDVAGNYPAQEIVGRDWGITADSPINQEVGMVAAQNATAHAFGGLVIVYSQYTKQGQPHFLSLSGYHESTGATSETRVMSGRRTNIEPINKLALTTDAGTDFKAGSLFSLYRVPKRIIERVELTAPQATITFDNIPDYYDALVIHVYAATDRVDINDYIDVEINGDGVAANYDRQYLRGAGVAATSAASTASPTWVRVPAADLVDEFGGGTMLFTDYANVDKHKACLIFTGREEHEVLITSGTWKDLAAIVSIALTPTNGPNFLPGSVFEFEGILRREGLPASAGMSMGIP